MSNGVYIYESVINFLEIKDFDADEFSRVDYIILLGLRLDYTRGNLISILRNLLL